MEEKPKSVIEGWRKMGVAMGAITALSLKETITFETSVIIGIIAIVGIVCQGVLDWRKNDSVQ